jgi:hypothetical protein
MNSSRRTRLCTGTLLLAGLLAHLQFIVDDLLQWHRASLCPGGGKNLLTLSMSSYLLISAK